ncbi:hypothetical protein SUDANB37_05711 [Streptomyces sp. enrichment culture]
MVAAGHSVDPARWQEVFEGLTSRIAGRFSRAEPASGYGTSVLGLLSELPRKNRLDSRRTAGERNPDGMRHLLDVRAMEGLVAGGGLGHTQISARKGEIVLADAAVGPGAVLL